MKRVPERKYLTVREIEERLRELNAKVDQLQGAQRYATLAEINRFRPYADAKRWLGSDVSDAAKRS